MFVDLDVTTFLCPFRLIPFPVIVIADMVSTFSSSLSLSDDSGSLIDKYNEEKKWIRNYKIFEYDGWWVHETKMRADTYLSLK